MKMLKKFILDFLQNQVFIQFPDAFVCADDMLISQLNQLKLNSFCGVNQIIKNHHEYALVSNYMHLINLLKMCRHFIMFRLCYQFYTEK